MLEGLWTVSFQSTMGNYRAGVLVFKEGRIYGGDAEYYYLGDYVVQENRITGEIENTHYGGPPSSIFGPMDKFRVTVTGEAKEPEMTLSGHLSNNPSFRFQAILNKRANK